MSESESSTIAELRRKLAGERAAFGLYRTSIETAVRLKAKIDSADLDELDIHADAIRVLAESRNV